MNDDATTPWAPWAHLFEVETRTAAEISASIEDARAAEAARISAHHAAMANAAIARRLNACPRCSGHGYLPQFQHHKGGSCFACGGTGLFARYA